MTSAAEVYGALSAKKARRLRLLARICLGFLTVFIGVVSLIPGPAVAQIDPFDLNDKIAHFIAYGVVGLVLPWAVTLRPQVAAGLAALTAYSGLVEILQAMLSER